MVPEIASAYQSRMKVADLSSPDEMATFNALQAAMEEAGLRKKNDIKSFTVEMEIPTPSDTMPDNERLLRRNPRSNRGAECQIAVLRAEEIAEPSSRK